jgi:predicted nucleic acid-binding protein
VVLIDTSVAVSLWIESERTSAARRLYAMDPDWSTEIFALIEFSNVMATYVRTKLSSPGEAQKRLEEAELLLSPRLVEIGHSETLQTALEFGVSAYDARFLATARGLDVKLVTEDERLRRAAPALTQSIDEALESS